MKATIDRFNKDLDQLGSYISFIQYIGNLLKYSPADTDSPYLKDRLNDVKTILSILPYRKVFEYNSIVISMYGFFEKFVEDIAVSYLDAICRFVPVYSDLPKEIQENHSYLSAQLVRNLNLPKFENEHLATIIMKLNTCLNINRSELNTIAFTEHSSNFRISSINEFFSRIGIKGISTKIKHSPSFETFLIKKFGSDFNIEQTDDQLIFNLLSDLAQRRNDISHGASAQGAILNNSMFPDYIEFLKEFSIAIYSVLNSSLLKYECKSGFKQAKFVCIFNDNILCLELKDITLKIGDKIIVKSNNPNSAYSERFIEEIQINKQSFNSITIDHNEKKVGFKLNNGVKGNQLFFVK